jgi:hypothetical protein
VSVHAFFIRRYRWLLVAAALLLRAVPLAAAEDSRSPEIRDALRDGTGNLWGMANGGVPGIYVLDPNTRWHAATPPGIPTLARPICLGLRADGTVICLWRVDTLTYQCSEHRGQTGRALASFSLPGDWARRETRLTGDSKGGMWLTQRAPEIYRLKADGVPECLHTISNDELRRPSLGNYPGIFLGTVRVCEDAGGRLWFWVTDPSGEGTDLRGALLYDGTDFVLHTLPLPDPRMQGALSLLAPKDAHHLWMGLSGWGLYTLDTGTFQAERVPDQPSDASYTPFAVRGHHGDWLFVMGQLQPEGGCTVWRLGEDARWKKLIDSVDAQFSYDYQEDRLWVWADRGAYVGSNDNGLWFLPNDGSTPSRVSWQQGFPLATPRRFFQLPDGRWLGIGGRGQTWVGEPDALFHKPSTISHPQVSILRTRAPLRADTHRHLWSLFDNHFSSLREWDGSRWTEHPFPPGLTWEPYAELLNVDLRGRPWIRFITRPDHTLIYDPAADHWDVFESFHAALEAQGGRPDAQFAPWNGAFDLARFGPFDLPRFGPDGQICYLTTQGGVIEFFDGHAWRRWNAEAVTGRDHEGFEGAPFFNRAGQLSVDENHRTLACVDGSHWQETAFEPGPADFDALARLRHPVLPRDMQLPIGSEGRALDNDGMWWLTGQGVLYRARGAFCVPVFKPGEFQPYLDGRGLGGAFVDANGNTFLSSDDINSGEYVILAPPGPPPRTMLAAVTSPGAGNGPAPPDQVSIHVTTTAGPVTGKFRFLWRLDEGPWTPLAEDGPTGTLTFDGLPGGAHRLEARSFDPALQTDVVPAGLTWEIHLDPQAQVVGYVKELGDPDYARRKAAIAALARQPDRAIPALQTARLKTNDDNRRWWIDAALQQIETTRRAAADKHESLQPALPNASVR